MSFALFCLQMTALDVWWFLSVALTIESETSLDLQCRPTTALKISIVAEALLECLCEDGSYFCLTWTVLLLLPALLESVLAKGQRGSFYFRMKVVKKSSDAGGGGGSDIDMEKIKQVCIVQLDSLQHGFVSWLLIGQKLQTLPCVAQEMLWVRVTSCCRL